ncbi:hypothetical protein C8R47DRAFT_1202685 [Mycena vitilis]|nr:hypothetical protein C8R47DRAFT_1202685 [Mycena vitilis]
MPASAEFRLGRAQGGQLRALITTQARKLGNHISTNANVIGIREFQQSNCGFISPSLRPLQPRRTISFLPIPTSSFGLTMPRLPGSYTPTLDVYFKKLDIAGSISTADCSERVVSLVGLLEDYIEKGWFAVRPIFLSKDVQQDAMIASKPGGLQIHAAHPPFGNRRQRSDSVHPRKSKSPHRRASFCGALRTNLAVRWTAKPIPGEVKTLHYVPSLNVLVLSSCHDITNHLEKRESSRILVAVLDTRNGKRRAMDTIDSVVQGLLRLVGLAWTNDDALAVSLKKFITDGFEREGAGGRARTVALFPADVTVASMGRQEFFAVAGVNKRKAKLMFAKWLVVQMRLHIIDLEPSGQGEITVLQPMDFRIAIIFLACRGDDHNEAAYAGTMLF